MNIFYVKLPFTLSDKPGSSSGKFKQIELIIEAEDEKHAIKQLQSALQKSIDLDIVDFSDIEVLYEEPEN